MQVSFKDVKNSYFIFFSLIVLFLQNIIIFWNHYFLGYFFPGDFERRYYATVAFFTSAIDSGIFPQWHPFQNMGYPLPLLVQSGFNYPIFWIFPIFSISYTLNAAVILQVIHIFVGSVGMFFLLKYYFKSPAYALVGAFAFQFFGGFYTSSAFPDVTRAFVLAPWLFYVFSLNLENPTIRRRILFIPIIIYLIVTGAYPGNIISSLFVMGIFVILQAINGFFHGFGKYKLLKNTAIMFSLIFLGLMISLIHLGPFIEHADQLVRLADYESQRYTTLSMESLPSLFMPSQGIPGLGQPWLLSTFVTLPILVLASFLPLSSLKKYWIFAVIFIIAFLMSMGNKSFFWEFVGSILSPLQYSRIPISDYKIFLVIPLMIFAIEGLRTIVERKLTWKKYGFRIAFIFSWFSLLGSIPFIFPNRSVVDLAILNYHLGISILILSIMFILIAYSVKTVKNKGPLFRKNTSKLSIVLIIILIATISFDGFIVISDLKWITGTSLWMGNPSNSRYVGMEFSLEKNDKLISYSIFENLPNQRPEREITDHVGKLSWKGNLDGSYMMQNYGANTLVPRSIVEQNQIYQNYMFMKWTPIFLDVPISLTNNLKLPDSIFSNINSKQDYNVVQTHYGINAINYSVSLLNPILMIENEMYFPGWKAVLIFPEKEIELDAISVNEVFRAWVLPEGNYQMKAMFQFPNYLLYQILTLSSFLIWIIIIIIFWRKLEIKTPNKA